MSDAIRGAVPVVASVLAGHLKVPVVWGEFDTASTIGGTIKLPDMPLKGSALARYVYGYIVHEAGHIRFTDFEAFSVSCLDPRLKILVNFMEDPRIEAGMCRLYAGAMIFLNDMQAALFEDGKLGVYDEALPLVEQVIAWVFWRSNVDLMQYTCLVELAQRQQRLVQRLLPEKMYRQLDCALARLRSANSTGDVVKIGQDILNTLGVETSAGQPQQADRQGGEGGASSETTGGGSGATASGQQPQQDGAGNDRPDDGGGTAAGEPPQANAGDQAGDSGQPNGAPQSESGVAEAGNCEGVGEGQSTGDGADAQPGDGQSMATGEGDCANQASADAPCAGQEPGLQHQVDSGQGQTRADDSPPESLDAEAIAALANADNWRGPGDKGELIRACLPDAIADAEADGGSGHGNARVHMPLVALSKDRLDGSYAMGEVRRHTTALRSAFEDALQDAMMDRVTAARSGRRLLRDANLRFMRGSTKVFRRQDETIKVNARLAVLIDASSSMLGDRLQTALKAALAMDLSLDQIDGVRTSISVFPARVSAHGQYDRHGVKVLKEFEDDVRVAAGRVASVKAQGSTPMAGALLHACAQLDEFDEGRRIVLVITDGKPDRLNECLAVMRYCDPDIEFVGIGIKQDLSNLFKTFVELKSIDDLPRKSMELVRGMLLHSLEPMAA